MRYSSEAKTVSQAGILAVRWHVPGSLRTIELFAIPALVLLVVSLAAASGQVPAKVFTIGVIKWLRFVPRHAYGPDSYAAFQQELNDRGYWLGQNLVFESLPVKDTSERLDERVAGLVRLKVDVIAASFAPSVIRAAQRATRSIPIVMQGVTVDPVEAGFVQSLAKPGGNITGVMNLESDLLLKRLDLLRQMLPQISRVLILWSSDQRKPRMKQIEGVAGAMGIQVRHLVREKPLEQHLEGAFSTIREVKPDALVVTDNELAIRYEPQIIEYVTKNRLPTMYGRSRFVKNGGLMSYGASLPHLYRRSATYVDRIFKGARPQDLPVGRPIKFDLVINVKTAKRLGLTIPRFILYEANEVIR